MELPDGRNGMSPLIYDRYDIWKFDPDAMKEPVNLTMNGRKNRISYRLVKLDKEERVVDLNKPQLLKGFNEVTERERVLQGLVFPPLLLPKN